MFSRVRDMDCASRRPSQNQEAFEKEYPDDLCKTNLGLSTESPLDNSLALGCDGLRRARPRPSQTCSMAFAFELSPGKTARKEPGATAPTPTRSGRDFVEFADKQPAGFHAAGHGGLGPRALEVAALEASALIWNLEGRGPGFRLMR